MTWTPVTLRGRLVRLEPLSREHLDGLIEATEDGRMWERWYTSVADPDGMAAAVEKWLTWQDEGFMLPFVTVRQAGDVVLGMTTFYDPQWDVPRVSVGHTWNRASTHGTGTNAESKLLLMTHAFEELGCRRALRDELGQSAVPDGDRAPRCSAGRCAARGPVGAQRRAAGHRGVLGARARVALGEGGTRGAGRATLRERLTKNVCLLLRITVGVPTLGPWDANSSRRSPH